PGPSHPLGDARPDGHADRRAGFPGPRPAARARPRTELAPRAGRRGAILRAVGGRTRRARHRSGSGHLGDSPTMDGNALLYTGITIVVIIGFLQSMAGLQIWLERKISAWLQDRKGPNRVGPFGLIQPVADGLKFIF